MIIENFDLCKNFMLGYNSCFAYNKVKRILALQQNNNGVGIDSLREMLMNGKPLPLFSGKANNEDIVFSVIEGKDKYKDANDFKSITFAVSIMVDEGKKLDYLRRKDSMLKLFDKFIQEECNAKI
jgi:hypothetical protein